MKYELYLITNVVNNKKYIGITTWGINRRFIRHKSDARRGDPRPLYAAIRKYGEHNFTVEPLQETEDWDQLCELEKHNITEHNTFIDNGKGYNLTLGGEGTPGRVLTEEHKQKILITRANWSEEKKNKVRDKQSKGVTKYWQQADSDTLNKRNAKVSKSRKKMLRQRSDEEANSINSKIQETLRKSPSKRKTCEIDGIKYFSISEASRSLNIPVDTIRNRIKSKNYPTYKEGKLYERT